LYFLQKNPIRFPLVRVYYIYIHVFNDRRLLGT